MTPQQLLQAGKLDEAIAAVSAEVRDNPQDVKRRTFLFELLCFSGDFSRAEKHLDLAAQGSQSAEMGALLYHAALHAERTRHEMFGKKEYPSPHKAASGELSIKVNGTLFTPLSMLIHALERTWKCSLRGLICGYSFCPAYFNRHRSS